MTADLTLSCRDCGQSFVFTVREQEFFAERGFGNPVRCLTCRRAHKAKRMGAPEESPFQPAPPPAPRPAPEAAPAPRRFDERPPRNPESRDFDRGARDFRPQREPFFNPPPPVPVYSAPEPYREARRPEPSFAEAGGGDPWEDRGRTKKKKEKRGGRPRYQEEDELDY